MPARRLERPGGQLALLALTLCMAWPLRAAPGIHKCQVNGSTVYQQDPCPPAATRRPPTVAELNTDRQRRQDRAAPATTREPSGESQRKTRQAHAAPADRCDGRRHCSQMRSCDEARHFLQHCPGVEMDGDGDGIPCEQQWCRR